MYKFYISSRIYVQILHLVSRDKISDETKFEARRNLVFMTSLDQCKDKFKHQKDQV